MKRLLAVISLLVSGAVAEPPAPYAPSGWRPSGPAFDLPQRGQTQQPQPQQYLPPVDPRNPAVPSTEYGIPDDVSVQVLPPQQEQQPIFLGSPINGPQYQGSSFNTDIRNLDQGSQQTQYQLQQEKYRQFERQKQLEASQPNNKANNLPSPHSPRQFASRTTSAPTSTTPKPELRTTEAPATQVTEANLNEREILEDDGPILAKQRALTSVEISKQNIQQYPGELFLSSLAQYQLQPQFLPLQQTKAAYYQPAIDAAQKQVGFDGPAHFSALPSVLAQQQAANPQGLAQNPALLIGEQPANQGFVIQQPLAQYQPANSYQPVPQPQPQYQEPIAFQPQAIQPNYLQPNLDAVAIQQPASQYQPASSYQPQVQTLPQFQAQPVVLQPQALNQQPGQFGQQPESEQNQENEYDEKQANQQQPQEIYQQPQQIYQQPQQVYQQPQQVYQQPQQFYQQPQQVYQQPEQLYQQPLFAQPQPINQYQAPQQIFPAQSTDQDLSQYYQANLVQPQFQGQTAQQQTYQSPDALQSGLDVNQEGNDIDQTEEKDAGDDSEEDEGSRTTAVATAFGARTQPRVFTQYGAPFPVPRVQAGPGYATTTESAVEDITEQLPVIAQAVAVSTNEGRKSAKLRSRRVRPVFTLDRSGHLVLAPGQ